MKYSGFALMMAISLLVVDCTSSGTNQELNGTPTPTQVLTPTPTPGEGSVIGRGVLNFTSKFSDLFPTTNQTVLEVGTIPFEIRLTVPNDQVEGKGVATLNYTIDYTQTGDSCVYQAIADVTLSGIFFAQPECFFNFKLTFNYMPPHLISNSSFCSDTLNWEKFPVEIEGMEAINGTKWGGLANFSSEEIVLTGLVFDDDTICFPDPVKVPRDK